MQKNTLADITELYIQLVFAQAVWKINKIKNIDKLKKKKKKGLFWKIMNFDTTYVFSETLQMLLG